MPKEEEDPSMPCNDVTEVIRIDLDHEDSVTGYELTKRTCGRAVGALTLIGDWVKGRSATDLLSVDLDAFQAAHPAADDAEEFLYLKHLFAIQSGLSVYLGIDAGGVDEGCVAESIGCGEDGMEFVGQIKIDVLTDKIASCGKCKGCGVKKRAKSPA